jgi:hypothetical protein
MLPVPCLTLPKRPPFSCFSTKPDDGQLQFEKWSLNKKEGNPGSGFPSLKTCGFVA